MRVPQRFFSAQQRGELDGQIVGFSSLKAGQSALWKPGSSDR